MRANGPVQGLIKSKYSQEAQVLHCRRHTLTDICGQKPSADLKRDEMTSQPQSWLWSSRGIWAFFLRLLHQISTTPNTDQQRHKLHEELVLNCGCYKQHVIVKWFVVGGFGCFLVGWDSSQWIYNHEKEMLSDFSFINHCSRIRLLCVFIFQIFF